MKDRKAAQQRNGIELATFTSSVIDLTIPANVSSSLTLTFKILTHDVILKICLMLAPEDIHALLTSHRDLFFEFPQSKKQQVWENKFNCYFPELAKEVTKDVDWYKAFKQAYQTNYKPLPTRARWLRTWIKEHDMDALKSGREVSARAGGLWKAKTKRVTIKPLQCSDIQVAAKKERLEKFAARHGNQEIFDFMYSLVLACKHANDECGLLTRVGKTILYYAVALNQLEVIETSELTNEEINQRVCDDARSLVYVATYKKNSAMISALTMKGADPNLRTRDWNAPLHLASENGDVESVKALLASKAEIEVKNRFWKTPLAQAARKGQLAVVEQLIAKSANVQSKLGPDYPNKAFEYAVIKGHLEIVYALMNAGSVVKSFHIEAALTRRHYHVALALYIHWIKKTDLVEARNRVLDLLFVLPPRCTGSIEQRLSAAEALLEVLNKTKPVETLAEHLPALSDGYLRTIVQCLDIKLPVARHRLG